MPDLTFILDVPASDRPGARQAPRGKGTTDRFEAEALDFHERVA